MEDDFYSPWNLWVHSMCQLAEQSYSPLKIGFRTALWVQGRAAVLWSSPSELCWSAHSLTAKYKEKEKRRKNSLPLVLFTATSISPLSAAWPRSLWFFSGHFGWIEISISQQQKLIVCVVAVLDPSLSIDLALINFYRALIKGTSMFISVDSWRACACTVMWLFVLCLWTHWRKYR